MKKNYLTKEWYEQLVEELHELKKIKLPAVLERLWEAKAMGDLSENFEYKSALEDKDLINSRIGEIETLIEDVEIIKEEKKSKSDKIIDYGSKVTVTYLPLRVIPVLATDVFKIIVLPVLLSDIAHSAVPPVTVETSEM